MSYTTERHHHDVDSCEHPSLCVNTRQYLSLSTSATDVIHPDRSICLTKPVVHLAAIVSMRFVSSLHTIVNYCTSTTFRSLDNELVKSVYNFTHQLSENVHFIVKLTQ